MKINSLGARWVPSRLALTLGVALTAAPAFLIAPPAHAAVTPVPVDDAYTTTQNAPVTTTMGFLSNDTMGDATAFSPITFPKHGIAMETGGGTASDVITYTPDAGYTGTDTLTYCLSKAIIGSACISEIATITFTVLAAVPVDDHFDTATGGQVTIRKVDVLVNDINANPAYINWSILVEKPKNGVLTKAGAGDDYLYTPSAGFTGTDTFKYCLTKSFMANTPCASGNATVSIDVGLRITSRVTGVDRYDVAVQIANRGFPTSAPVVFIASGANFPDALSAGPAATKLGGPLLLTYPDSLPAAVKAKILALAPAKVIIVGGVNSVSEVVEVQIRNQTGATVERIGGADRYEVSRAIANRAFGAFTHAYVATGANFPDALSAGAAAGSVKEPVILVKGDGSAADAPTLALLAAHSTTKLTIVGGINSVSSAMETSLGTVGTVTRIAGADRYEASSNLNHTAFMKADTVYVATGLNYPDALAGTVIAGFTSSPLYVVPRSCVPRSVLDDITRLGAKSVVLLGGPNSLTDDVARLVPCAA